MRVHKMERYVDIVRPVRFALRAMPKHQLGFTLVELMVTVVIIGILSAIAYPSYTQYVLRANRAEARAILLESVQFLERNYTTANRYDQTSAGAAIVLPYPTSPKTGTTPKYNITAAYGVAPAQTFTLSATPTGVMSGDACGTYTLDNAGIQGSGGTIAECWGK